MSNGYLSKDRERLARLQRERRARMRRIDYMPGRDALAVIEVMQARQRPGSQAATNSAVLDAIVTEWAELTGIKYDEVSKPMTSAASAGIIRPFRAGAYDFGGAPEFRHASQARAPAYDSMVENSPKQAARTVCGARRHRDGQPCQALSEPGKRRCRFHGGRSTGPRTDKGRQRALANLRRGR